MTFDLDQMKRRTGAVDLDGIDFDAFRDDPLTEDALRCIRYMHDVENHTICYLRDVLVTDAHRDVEITAFLTFWAFEEYWHGEALGSVLAAHGESPLAREQHTRRRVTRTGHDRYLPLLTWLANACTRHVPAVHMTWGAINEWTTQAAYARLAVRADHPVLSDLLGRIRRQEGRHIDFYCSQATERLGASSTARRLTRTALSKLWDPVGSAIVGPGEVNHLAGYLFSGDDGAKAVARIDRNVDRLPGLHGLHLVTQAADRLGAAA